MAKDMVPEHPKPLLKVRVSDYKAEPWLIAMCAGYESG